MPGSRADDMAAAGATPWDVPNGRPPPAPYPGQIKRRWSVGAGPALLHGVRHYNVREAPCR